MSTCNDFDAAPLPYLDLAGATQRGCESGKRPFAIGVGRKGKPVDSTRSARGASAWAYAAPVDKITMNDVQPLSDSRPSLHDTHFSSLHWKLNISMALSLMPKDWQISSDGCMNTQMIKTGQFPSCLSPHSMLGLISFQLIWLLFYSVSLPPPSPERKDCIGLQDYPMKQQVWSIHQF